METPVCVAGSQACGIIAYPSGSGWAACQEAFFPFAYPPELQMKPPCTSYSPDPGPRTQKGLLYAHCTDGSPWSARLVFLSLFLAWSGMAGSPDHLALRVTGGSLGQVGRTSLSDPRLREGHPSCYFWLFQVGPGLLPPQRATAARTWWPAGSHMMSASSWPRRVRGESTPHSGPHPFLRRPGGARGESQGMSSTLCAQSNSA